MNKIKVFSVFRYQLLPTSSNLQKRLDTSYETIEDLIADKNNIFRDILLHPKTNFRGKGYSVLAKVLESFDEKYFIKMGVEKKINIRDKDFKTKTENDYPNSLVYINNDPLKQFLLIEHESEAFYEPLALKNIIEKSLQITLEKYGLSVYIEKVTSLSDFWSTIFEYKDKIKSLKFEFIRPNMANISGKAVQAIRILKNNSNSHKTTLELNAPQKGILENLDPENEEINGLAEYCSDGGGESSIRIKNYRKRIKTNKKELKIEVEEIEFINLPLDKISQLLEMHLGRIDE
jgi:hypothetical protein